jgi:hypothetical protein
LRRPATAGQFGIERIETGRHDGTGLMPKVASPPEALCNTRRQVAGQGAGQGAPGARCRWMSEAPGRQDVVAGPCRDG